MKRRGKNQSANCIKVQRRRSYRRERGDERGAEVTKISAYVPQMSSMSLDSVFSKLFKDVQTQFRVKDTTYNTCILFILSFVQMSNFFPVW